MDRQTNTYHDGLFLEKLICRTNTEIDLIANQPSDPFPFENERQTTASESQNSTFVSVDLNTESVRFARKSKTYECFEMTKTANSDTGSVNVLV